MSHPSPDHMDRFPVRTYLYAAGLLGFAVAALLVAAHLRGIPMIRMLRDPASFYEYSPLSGIVSYGGILLMTSTAAISGFAAYVGFRWRGLLVAVATFSGYFALDDLFMLHDGVWPRFGIPEEAIMVGFASAGLGILLAAQTHARPWRTWGLYLALALMSGSILIDVSLQSDYATVAEDILKFLSIGIWALFWTGVSSRAVGVQARTHAVQA
ncbi:hypothetical protein [Paracoccus endophyticus]|uniref:hypothetical protein n=1 Tax=Paracoccus endophyticus TaxID=2233774 RepID=UPI0013A6AC10|nr:hypothetical protein [Paracoccus endophyticus]